MAQPGVDPLKGTIAPLDIYGNAQTIHPERRPLEIFQNDVQNQIMNAYQSYNRPISQRGFGGTFALPGDQFMRTMLRGTRPTVPGLWQQRPSPFGLQARERKTAFSAYGGFSQRRSPYAPGDPEGMFARKRSLIAATGSTAPIERSQLNRGYLGTMRFPIAQTPFQANRPVVPEPGQPDQTDIPAPASLDQFLTSETRVLHDRAQAEGWGYFHAGDYRAAMRAFESAAMLDPDDAASRVGEVFSYFALGSFRAAILSLDENMRRDANVFDHDVSVTDRFASAAHAQQVRLTAQSIAEASEQGVEMKGLAIYVLWFMDAREDAMRAAKALAEKDARTAHWPKLMQAADARRVKASS